MTNFKISTLQKRMLIDMIKYLFPSVRWLWVTKSGTIYISKGLFRWIKIHISEMCLSVLPIKIKDLFISVNPDAYNSVYNQYSHMIVNLLNSGVNANHIIKYLYNEYCNVKYNISHIDTSIIVEIPEVTITTEKTYRYLPVLSNVSAKLIKPNLISAVKELRGEGNTISNEITKLLQAIKNMFRYKRSRKKVTQLRMLLQVNLQ